MIARLLVAVICSLGVLLLLRRKITSDKLRPGRQGSESAFTLIELLVVICIIGILAALTLNVAGYIQKKGARARTEAEMAAMAALESYRADNGSYPEVSLEAGSGSSDETKKFVEALMPPDAASKVYFEFNKNMLQTNSGNLAVVDPFGEVYGYSYPGSQDRGGTNFFDLWSRAGTKDTNQWIQNW